MRYNVRQSNCAMLFIPINFFFNSKHALWPHVIKRTLAILPYPLDEGLFTNMQNYFYCTYQFWEKDLWPTGHIRAGNCSVGYRPFSSLWYTFSGVVFLMREFIGYDIFTFLNAIYNHHQQYCVQLRLVRLRSHTNSKRFNIAENSLKSVHSKVLSTFSWGI